MQERVFDVKEGARSYEQGLILRYLECGSAEQVVDQGAALALGTLRMMLKRYGVVGSPNGRRNNGIAAYELFHAGRVEGGYSVPETVRLLMRKGVAVSGESWHRLTRNVARRIEGDDEGIDSWKYAVALIVTMEDEQDKILVGNDLTTPSVLIGKTQGALTIPVCFALESEDPKGKILRVLQREVFSYYVLEGELGAEDDLTCRVIPACPEPFATLDVADVTVDVYRLVLDAGLYGLNFSSPKLDGLRFVGLDEIGVADGVRAGVKDAVMLYRAYMDGSLPDFGNITLVSEFNMALAGYPTEDYDPIFIPRYGL